MPKWVTKLDGLVEEENDPPDVIALKVWRVFVTLELIGNGSFLRKKSIDYLFCSDYC